MLMKLDKAGKDGLAGQIDDPRSSRYPDGAVQARCLDEPVAQDQRAAVLCRRTGAVDY